MSVVSNFANATNYTLWVSGRGVIGNYADFSYWGPSSTAAGVNKKASELGWVQ